MAANLRPRVTKRERKLHLSYNLPHRIHTSHIYPIIAPNGSALIIYGYDGGLRILWRGGRRRKELQQSAARTNGNPSDVEEQDLDNTFETEEEELDPQCPYPPVLQDLTLPTGGDVLHIGLPALQLSSITPQLLQRTAVVAIASADGALRVLQIPLLPPADDEKDHAVEAIVDTQVELAANGPIVTSLAVKFSPAGSWPPTTVRPHEEDVEGRLLIAAVSRSLNIWAISVTAEALVAYEKSLLPKVPMQSHIVHAAFHPSAKSTQLLLADISGVARIYDPYALKMPQKRPGSSDSALDVLETSTDPGREVMAFHTSYHTPKSASPSPSLARRKKLLDTRWVLAGKGILALLEDGQWGIWDVTAAAPGKRVEDFTIDGFLATSSSDEPGESAVPKKGISKLAPMTPNTRKSKAEQLFTSAKRAPGAVPKGGISVATINSRTGHVDESVILWYDSEIYSIASLQTFWQRSTTDSRNFGSLYAPGIAHITDVNLSNEEVTSISQLKASSSSAGIGQMNTHRDLLISAEYRAIILQALRPPTPALALFQKEMAERPAARDPVSLETGAMDILDINRALDNMGTNNIPTKSVGFAR